MLHGTHAVLEVDAGGDVKPASHAEQAAPPVEKDPALQVTQSLAAVMPVASVVCPAGQSLHSEPPSPYVPISHLRQSNLNLDPGLLE